MFVDADLRLCVLTSDSIAEGTKSTCLSQRIILQIAINQAYQSFLYFTVIFHLKGKESVLPATLYVENDSKNDV